MKTWGYLVLFLIMISAVAAATPDDKLNSTVDLYLGGGGVWYGHFLIVVDGTITDPIDPAVPAQVTVFCETDGKVVELCDTPVAVDADGYFKKEVPLFCLLCTSKCDNESETFINVTYMGRNYTSGKEPVLLKTYLPTDMNFYHARVNLAVPEFSTATMVLAVIGVTLGIVVLRRKQ